MFGSALKLVTQVVTKVPLKTIGITAGIVGGVAGIVGGDGVEETAETIKNSTEWLDDKIGVGLNLLDKINF